MGSEIADTARQLASRMSQLDQPGYEEWMAAFNVSRDPVEASELMRTAMAY